MFSLCCMAFCNVLAWLVGSVVSDFVDNDEMVKALYENFIGLVAWAKLHWPTMSVFALLSGGFSLLCSWGVAFW